MGPMGHKSARSSLGNSSVQATSLEHKRSSLLAVIGFKYMLAAYVLFGTEATLDQRKISFCARPRTTWDILGPHCAPVLLGPAAWFRRQFVSEK